MGKAICCVCKQEKEYKTEGLPIYKQKNASGKMFVCVDCIRAEYQRGVYYQRIMI